jgi:hypothetical protein
MAKRKPNPPDANVMESYHLAGCIGRRGRVIDDGYVLCLGSVWISRASLPEAQRWGWKATGQENGDLIVVRRASASPN